MAKFSFRAAKEQVVKGYEVVRDGAKKRFARKPRGAPAPRAAPRPPSLASFKAGLKAKILELARHEDTRDVKAGPNGLTLHISHENEAAAQEARESLLKLVEDHQGAFAKAGWAADVTDFPHPDNPVGPLFHSAITFSGSKSTPLGRLFRRDAAGFVSALNDAASRELIRKALGGAAPSAPAPSKPQAAPAKPPASPSSPSRPPAPASAPKAPAPGSPARPPVPFSAGSPAKPPASPAPKPPVAPGSPAPAPAPKPLASPGSPSRLPAPADAAHGATTPAPSSPAQSGGSASGKGSGIHFAPVINVTGGNPVANTGRGGVNTVSGEGAQGNIYQDGSGSGGRNRGKPPKKGK